MFSKAPVAVLAALASRVVAVYGLTALVDFGLRRRPLAETIPRRWQHVLNWSGLRGVIRLALALSLPATLGPDRALIRIIALQPWSMFSGALGGMRAFWPAPPSTLARPEAGRAASGSTELAEVLSSGRGPRGTPQ